MSHEHDEGLTGAQLELEQALAHLRPARGGLSREQVLFRAGLAAGRSQGRRWNLTMAAAVLVTGAAAVLAASRGPETKVVERIVYRDAPRQVRPAEPQLASAPVAPAWPTDFPAVAVQAGYLRLRQAVLEKGLDALPAAPARAAGDDLSDLWPSAGRPGGPASPPRDGGGPRRRPINGDRS